MSSHAIYFPASCFWPARQSLIGLSMPKTVDIRINLLHSRLLVTQSKLQLKALIQSVTARIWRIVWSVISYMAKILMGISLVVSLVVFGPKLYYSLFPAEPVQVIARDSGTPQGGEFAQGTENQAVQAYQPEVDPNLPLGDWLVIPRIGVRTNLIVTNNPEEALDLGVWQVPGYGEPGATDQPLILAAHRYGFRFMWETVLDDGNTYALRHIFYKLPETEPGDQIEIIHEQKRYVYEIYAGEEAHDISDYDADLILYTCKFIDSPVRLIRYARLIDPTADSQSLVND